MQKRLQSYVSGKLNAAKKSKLKERVSDIKSYKNRERVRMAQRQNDTVVKMTRSSNRHGESLWHGRSLWHSEKMARYVTLAKRQNGTVRHFGTATK